MRSLNFILMLLGALSVLVLGAVPASAMTSHAPPCHEAGAVPSQGQSSAPSGAPGKATTGMACCVSCLVSATLPPAPGAPSAVAATRPETVPASLPVGLSPMPEHGPPKA